MAQPAEIELILNTDQFLQAAKELAPQLEKALKLDAKTLGNQVIEDRQKALKENLVEARLLSKETNAIAKGFTTKGLDEYKDKLAPILETVRKIEETEKRLTTVQARIGELEGSGSGSINSLKGKIGGVKGESEKEAARRAYRAAKNELVDLKKEETNLLITQAQLNQTFDEQYPKVKYICDTMKKVNAEGSKNKDHIKAITSTYDALKDTTSQTKHNIEDANKTLDEMEVPKSGIDSVKEETEALQDAVSAEKELSAIKKVENETEAKDEHSEERENKILDQVKAIYELRLAGEDASEEFAKLQELLNFDFAKADVGELARFLHDTKEATRYISTDLSNTERLDDVFKDITKATVPASQSFTQLTNSFKSNTMSAEAERKILEEILRVGEYVAKLNLDPTKQSFGDIAQSLGILQSAESLAKKLGVPDEVKGQYDEIVRAIIRLKDAQSQLKKSVLEEGTATKKASADQEQFRNAMQGVIDTTDRINNSMRFDGPNVSIAELIRRLHDLKEAQQTLEEYGLPREMDTRYEMLNQLIAKTTVQINEYKQALKDSITPAKIVGQTAATAGEKIGKSASEFKLASGSVKQLKDGFKSLSSISNKIKSSFNGMARDMKSNFKHLLTNITKYIFGFRSLFFLIRRMRKYLVEGIENLVQYDSANNQTNAAISELRTSLLYLKNAWAAAFAPIINIIVPIINSFLDMLAVVGNAIARFIGLLTGQAPVLNAVRVSAGDYAESLGGVGDSAGGAADKVKELTDRLADFDDLNVLGVDKDPSDTGSGGGGGGGGGNTPSIDDMFEWVDVDDSIFQKLLESWENADFTWLGELLRDKIIEALDWLNNNWDEIQTIADKLGHSFGSFLVGLLGEPDLWEKSAHAIAEAFNTINIGISAFLDELDKIPFGKNAGISVNEFLQTTDWNLAGENINRVITGIVDNITDFVNTLDAQAVADAITDFLTGLDIPSVVVSVKELLLSATRLFIEVIADLTVNAGMAFGDWLTKWVSEGVTTTYVDKDGVHVQLGFDLKTDWTEHPIIALFERIANAIAAHITTQAWEISVKLGFDGDLGDFIELADVGLNSAFSMDTFNNSINAVKNAFAGLVHGEGFDLFPDKAAETTNAIDDTTTAVDNLSIATAGVNGVMLDFDTNLPSITENVTGMGVATEQATDVMTTGYNTASESITTYNYNVDQAIKQTNEKLNENTTTTEEWKNNTVQAAGEVSTSFSDMGDVAIGASASVGTATHDAEGNVTDMKNTVTVAVGDTAQAWTDMADTVNDTGVEFSVTVDDVQASAESLPPPVVDSFSSIETGVTDSTTNIQTTLQEIWTSLSEEIPALAQTMTETMQINFNEFQVTSNVTWTNIRTDVTNRITELKTNAISLATALKTNLISIWTATKDATVNQFNLMRSGVVSNFQGLAQDIRTPANQFLSAIENMVNRSIDAINSLFEAVRKAMSMGSAWLNYMGLPEITVPANVGHVSVPRLAQGAVIPPNKEFLAVLGDQSHGTNIEAPLDTIKQAVAEVLANNNNQEVVQLLQELITVVENKDLTIGDKDIGLANARYTKRQQIIRGTSF